MGGSKWEVQNGRFKMDGPKWMVQKGPVQKQTSGGRLEPPPPFIPSPRSHKTTLVGRRTTRGSGPSWSASGRRLLWQRGMSRFASRRRSSGGKRCTAVASKIATTTAEAGSKSAKRRRGMSPSSGVVGIKGTPGKNRTSIAAVTAAPHCPEPRTRHACRGPGSR